MFSDDAVGLSDYDVMVIHGSLSQNAPKWAANVAFDDEMRTPKSLALGASRTAKEPTARTVTAWQNRQRPRRARLGTFRSA